MHATIRPFRHRLITHQKVTAYGVTVAGVWVLTVMLSTATFIIRQRYGMVIQLLRMAIIHLFVSIGYLVCFILLHCYKISVWSGEIIIVCVDQIV